MAQVTAGSNPVPSVSSGTTQPIPAWSFYTREQDLVIDGSHRDGQPKAGAEWESLLTDGRSAALLSNQRLPLALALASYPERRLVDVQMSGAVSSEEIEAYSARLLADPAYAPGYDTLTDMREMSTAVCPELLRNMAHRKKAYLDRLIGTHRAVVVSREAVFGTMRLFEGLTGGDASPFQMFRTMKDDRIRLGMDRD